MAVRHCTILASLLLSFVTAFGTNQPLGQYDCPQGYKLTPGDIPGWGNSIKPGGYLNQNIGQCEDLCNANNLCCSFEWSPTERRCNLNQECVPTEGKYKDYLFCHKPLSTLRCADWQCLAKYMAANQAELFTHEQEIGSMKQEMDAIRSQLAALNSRNQAQSQVTYKQEKIHEECTNYKTLNYPGRAPSNRARGYRDTKLDSYGSSRVNANPDWKGENRYRFTGPFTRMAVKGEVTSHYQCGARVPCYIEDPKVHDNLKIGEMKDFVRACCVHRNNKPCDSNFYITITRCPGDYFVYRLRGLGGPFVACGSK